MDRALQEEFFSIASLSAKCRPGLKPGRQLQGSFRAGTFRIAVASIKILATFLDKVREASHVFAGTIPLLPTGGFLDKGKPIARLGRKAMGPQTDRQATERC
jgi:hypothetical protein